MEFGLGLRAKLCKCSRKAHRSRALHDPQLIALQDEELGERPHALGGYHELGPSVSRPADFLGPELARPADFSGRPVSRPAGYSKERLRMID